MPCVARTETTASDDQTRALPGVQALRSQLSIPRNALALDWVAARWQPGRAVRQRDLHFNPTRVKREALEACLPYQREGLNRALKSQGFHLHWAPGAGKTLGALIWALAECEGRVLFLTRGGAVGTIASECQRWTNARVQICRGEEPRKRRVRVPGKRSGKLKWGVAEVDASAVMDSTADIFICGYEVLPFWIEYFEQISITSCVLDEVHRVKSRLRSQKRIDAEGHVFYVKLNNQASAAQSHSGWPGRLSHVVLLPPVAQSPAALAAPTI